MSLPRPRRLAGIVVATVLVLSAVACRGAGEQAQDLDEVIEASPIAPTPSSSPSSSPGEIAPTPTPSPTESPTEEAREPTDTDRARFVADYRPEGATDLEHVAVDIDGDDSDELVFAYVGSGRAARIDVAWWTGTAYRIEYRAEGGPARQIERLRVADVNDDGITEVVTFQSNGSGGSLTLWQVVGEKALSGLRADGGCADGLNTYGVVGAELEDRDGDGDAEIYATCDGSPLPVAAWPTHVYEWENGAYRFRRELQG